jgi:D-cysteine desulfhydrase
VHLILRGEAPADVDGNLLLDHLAGASVSHYSQNQYVTELPELFAHWQSHYEERGGSALCIPTGASDGIGIWGYIHAAEELLGDMAAAGIENADWICATGSGGTQAGLTLGAALADASVRVWGINVCDDEAWFLRKVSEDIADCARRYPQMSPAPEVDARVIDGYVGPGYGRAEAEIFETIARVARLEGLVLDPVYTGKAFHGMLSEIGKGRFGDDGDIIFVHTGGIFGLFPQRVHFRNLIA